jgi:hypothetical protein
MYIWKKLKHADRYMKKNSCMIETNLIMFSSQLNSRRESNLNMFTELLSKQFKHVHKAKLIVYMKAT